MSQSTQFNRVLIPESEVLEQLKEVNRERAELVQQTFAPHLPLERVLEYLTETEALKEVPPHLIKVLCTILKAMDLDDFMDRTLEDEILYTGKYSDETLATQKTIRHEALDKIERQHMEKYPEIFSDQIDDYTIATNVLANIKTPAVIAKFQGKKEMGGVLYRSFVWAMAQTCINSKIDIPKNLEQLLTTDIREEMNSYIHHLRRIGERKDQDIQTETKKHITECLSNELGPAIQQMLILSDWRGANQERIADLLRPNEEPTPEQKEQKALQAFFEAYPALHPLIIKLFSLKKQRGKVTIPLPLKRK